MITVENYIEDVNRYNVAIPEGFKSSDAMMHEYHKELEKYGENEAVIETRPTAEKYVKMLNAYLLKNEFEFKEKTTSKPSSKTVSTTKLNAKTTKKVVKHEPKEKTIKTPKVVVKPHNMVDELPIEIRVFSRYLKFHGKIVTVKQLKQLLLNMARSAKKGLITKSSPYKNEWNQIGAEMNETLVSTDINKTTIDYVIPDHLKENLTNLVKDFGLRPSIVLIKKYLTEYGKENNADKLKALNITASKAIEAGKILKTDKHIKDLLELKEFSEDYIKSGHWKITQEQLNGFGTIGGLGSVPEFKNTLIPANKVMNTTDFIQLQFSKLELTGKWKAFIGTPSPKFRMMIFGKPGCGKSTLALMLGHYLASDLDKRTLYVANEEALRSTLKDKIVRLKLAHPNFDLVEEMPTNLKQWDYVFFDSADDLKIDPEEMKEIDKKHPKTTFISIHKVTKEGLFKGSNDWEHDVDICVKVEDGVAKSTKNRCGGAGTFKVY